MAPIGDDAPVESRQPGLAGLPLDDGDPVLLRVLARREAQRMGIVPDDRTMQETADEFRLAHGLLTVEDFSRWAAAAGIDEADFVSYLRDTCLVRELGRENATELDALADAHRRVSSARNWHAPPVPTVWETARAHLAILLDTLPVDPATGARATELVAGLAERLDDRPVDLPPRWSFIGDDCSPFGYSVALCGAQQELRLQFEAQADPASPESYWKAGLRVNDWLAPALGADLRRFEAVADLFAPAHADCNFAMLHGIDFRVGSPPLLKLYLNAAARGWDRRAETIRAALHRLGCAGAWPAIERTLDDNAVLAGFALDLTATPEARAKVYVRRSDSTTADLDAACMAARSSCAGEAARFASTVTGGVTSFKGRAPLVHYAMTDDGNRPAEATVQFKIAAYTNDDAVAHERIVAALGRARIDPAPIARAVRALAGGPLRGQRGLQTHASFKHSGDEPVLTVYFGARVYLARYGTVGTNPARIWPSPWADRAPSRRGR